MSSTSDPFLRVYYWFTDDANRIMLQYFLAAGLGLGSILWFIFGDSDEITTAQVALVIASGVILFYMALSNSGQPRQ